MLMEQTTEHKQIAWTLVDAIDTYENSMCYTIHGRIHSVPTTQERTVEDEIILVGRQLAEYWWTSQPIVKNALYGRSTVSAVLDQLPDGVAFGDPVVKPNKLALVACTVG